MQNYGAWAGFGVAIGIGIILATPVISRITVFSASQLVELNG